jgi:hypothetical protein
MIFVEPTHEPVKVLEVKRMGREPEPPVVVQSLRLPEAVWQCSLSDLRADGGKAEILAVLIGDYRRTHPSPVLAGRPGALTVVGHRERPLISPNMLTPPSTIDMAEGPMREGALHSTRVFPAPLPVPLWE